MDEYAEYIYQRRPEYRHLSAGDVVAQKKLRVSLNCKSFKWFMTKIAWDLPKFYPPVEPPAAAWGEVSVNGGAGPSLQERAQECLNVTVLSSLSLLDPVLVALILCRCATKCSEWLRWVSIHFFLLTMRHCWIWFGV
jgi:hypothetical protein